MLAVVVSVSAGVVETVELAINVVGFSALLDSGIGCFVVELVVMISGIIVEGGFDDRSLMLVDVTSTGVLLLS